MRKLALSDEILMSIEKPARYIGGEYNSVMKDKEQVDVRFCMCFPDVYEIGMSHLGIQILYDMFNRREDTWCERVYSPWPDLHKVMKEQHIPLFALESQDPLKEFDFLGITLQYEMCYTNILQVLDLAEIPIWSKDREKGDPIVIGGGPCSYNPEPIADFFDIFYIGEGETVYGDLIELYKIYKHSDMTREEFLIKVSQIPGLYVPALYDVTYHEDGTIASFGPKYEEVPKTILKQVVTDMSSAVYPEKPVVSYMKVTQDRVVLEIMRGCIRGCRFCQAGMIYRPTRPKDVNVLKHYAEAMLDNTGQEEITFSSLSSSDYQSLPELTDCLIEKMDNNHVNISLPSLRIDAFSLDVMQKIQDIKKNSLTFAPEAGTQRLRNVINKGLTKENILNGSLQAFLGGWNKVKLYFMMGLPTETYDDITGIADLSEEISELYFANIPKEKRDGRVMVSASASYFVPKPFTPFQWAPMITPEEFQKRAYFVKDKFREAKNHKSLKFAYHEADITILEGLLARGDRKLCQVIYDVYQSGQIFDAWTEYFDKSNWDNALEKNHIDIGFYTYRDRCVDEILPWDFIDIGVTRKFMEKEWERAQYLHAYYLPTKEAKRFVLLSHGYKGSGFGDFAYTARFLHENACNLLFIDQRCCGLSEGEYITFGAKEQWDVQQWSYYIAARNREKLPIYLYGESMGAAAVLMASGHKLPEEVKGLIADCGFCSMKRQLQDIAANWFHLGWVELLLFRVDLFCRMFGRFRMSDADTIEAMKKNKRPVLFFHGEADTYVVPENSVYNYALCSAPKELVIIPEARHLCAPYAAPELYRQKLLDFFEKYDN